MGGGELVVGGGGYRCADGGNASGAADGGGRDRWLRRDILLILSLLENPLLFGQIFNRNGQCL